MISELLLSKVGLFDVEPNRQSVTKRLLKNYCEGDYVWFLDDDGLRFAHAFGRYTQTLSKLSASRLNYAPFPRENGFDIHAKNGPSVQYSSLLITKHAIERWEQRARQFFPSIDSFHKMDELLATRGLHDDLVVNYEAKPVDYFFPFGEGAFIVEVTMTSPDNYFKSISELKKTSCVTNYTYSKVKNAWVGEMVPRAANKVVKTYLGWEELKRGGTFNSIDWMRQSFEWQQLPSEWNKKLIDMGVEL